MHNQTYVVSASSEALRVEVRPDHDRPSRQDEPRDGLLSVLFDSDYQYMLASTSWIEFPRDHVLSEEWDIILSGCWTENPLLNFATAVLFAGCVLYRTRYKNAVLCLVAESYGRGLDVDVHGEKPIIIGDSVSSCSQPSSAGEYPHATVCCILNDKHDERLVIGCKSFNALITGLWKLDRDCSSNRGFTAGCCASAFPVDDNEKIRIFIDKRSFDLAKAIAEGKQNPRFAIDYVRQIRSNFDHCDSYRMGRAASFFIRNMVSAQPATIFSLSVVSPGSGASPVSTLFCRIAKAVNKQGREAVLMKDWVTQALNALNAMKETEEDKKDIKLESGDIAVQEVKEEEGVLKEVEQAVKDVEQGVVKKRSLGVLLRRLEDLFKNNEEIHFAEIRKNKDLQECLRLLSVALHPTLKGRNDANVVRQLTNTFRHWLSDKA